MNILVLDDEIRELIVNNASAMEIKKVAMNEGYKPLVVDGIKKILAGTTNLQELNNKLALY